ncbi:CDP-alcohol phosphatidyltransferase family protein [Kangiella koreensis]|uniref:CDP-diacylglycerol--glycerol-3-phosphate 3-phosphatidyltransferase n=1 Tax=Kangiella koreensis (strain DSM 16069 / JCM 12317 / KCTC 12182 / SW-125) TaxID=523791 RepID=C7RCV2_KANKD|nr:CDP-alcohol phosphatidyltransferase family protein [Kangiella koreensis]ACV27094.1 CDP-alcohol phosphatidyltransferase [Kangiella koreensis DSM 16069]
MSLSVLPNLITIMRIILIIPFAYYVMIEQYALALVIFLIAGLSDGLDGLLAKRFRWQSRFGSITDPLADKLLLLVALLLLVVKGHISWTLFWVSTARDVIIVGGATSYHYFVGPYEMRPSLISKWNTALLILLVLLVLVTVADWYSVPDILLQGLEITVILTCIISGLHYIWLGVVNYKAVKNNKQPLSESSHDAVKDKAETNHTDPGQQ